jgi:hypothetical protein
MTERPEFDTHDEALYGDAFAYGGPAESRLLIRRQLIGSAVVLIGVVLFAGLAEFRPAVSDPSATASRHLWAAQQPVFARPFEEHVAGLRR